MLLQRLAWRHPLAAGPPKRRHLPELSPDGPLRRQPPLGALPSTPLAPHARPGPLPPRLRASPALPSRTAAGVAQPTDGLFRLQFGHPECSFPAAQPHRHSLCVPHSTQPGRNALPPASEPRTPHARFLCPESSVFRRLCQPLVPAPP